MALSSSRLGSRLGSLDRAIHEQHRCLLPPLTQYTRKQDVLSLLRGPLESKTGGSLHTFGSCENGLWTRGSDVDGCLVVSECDSRAFWLSKLKVASSVIRRTGVVERSSLVGSVQMVQSARVPVAKVFDKEGVNVLDLSINNTAALDNSALVSLFGRLDTRFRVLARVVKWWASARGINNRAQGTLSTYTLVLMVAWRMQMKGVLPEWQDMQKSDAKTSTDWGGKYLFENDSEIVNKRWLERTRENSLDRSISCAELFVDFFDFFGSVQSADGVEICSSAPFVKSEDGTLVVRCPLTEKNVNPMTRSSWVGLWKEFSRAREILNSGGDLSKIVDIVPEESAPSLKWSLPPRPQRL